MPSVEGVDDNVPLTGYGVRGRSVDGHGLVGHSDRFIGVFGDSNNTGVAGDSRFGVGVYGHSYERLGVQGYCPLGTGVAGYSDNYIGVFGDSISWYGVGGRSKSGYGVGGVSDSGYGVDGRSGGGPGVFGFSLYGPGVYGYCSSSVGMYGRSDSNTGMSGHSDNYVGVFGDSYSGIGIYGYSPSGVGVYGRSDSGVAAVFNGNVNVTGKINKAAVQFKIDHPLDPANKYLYHSSVESPDMKNVYDGVVTLDDNGEAVIELPDWFGALNKDFRYQLTAIGGPGPNLYIAEEIPDGVTNYSNSNSIHSSHFKIAGGTSGMKVSWQVTGIRQDPWANVNRIQVEEDKPDKEKGYYIYPDLYEQPPEKGISHLLFPEEEKWQEQLIK